MDNIPYEISSTEKVQNLEKELQSELDELRTELEDNDILQGASSKNISSVPMPKNVTYFRRERELVLKRAMQVCEAKPLKIQAHVMLEEMNLTGRSDYSENSLPLLIHQFFIDRIQQLVQMKHMHMLRWKRFCAHTSVIESLYPCYQTRLSQIMSEYNDCVQRAGRLAACREAALDEADATGFITTDDLFIYLRWLVCHLHSTKHFTQYMRVLEWLPVIHKKDISVKTAEDQISDEDLGMQVPLYNRSDSNTTVISRESVLGVTSPKAPNPYILSSYPQPYSQGALAFAAAGGGMASDEVTLNIPLHTNDLNRMKPQLTFLAHLYGIEVDVQDMSTFTEEMELFVAVNRKFRTLFMRQEQMRTFKQYDALQVGEENWGVESWTRAMLQDANWLTFVTVQPHRDLRLHKKMVELRVKKNTDELLRMMAKFLEISDTEKVLDALREHATAVHNPVTPVPVSVTSHVTANHTRSIWKKIYCNPELHDESLGTFRSQNADEKDGGRRDGKRARANSAHKRRDSYDYMISVQNLGFEEPGELENGDSNSLQGAHLSLLMLRHLRLRDLQRTCLSILNYFRSVERTMTINDGGLSLAAGCLKRISRQSHRQCVVDGGAGGGGGLDFHHYLHFTPRDYKINEVDFMQFSEVDNHDDFYTHEEGRSHVQDQQGYYIIYDVAKDDLKSLQEDLLLVASHYIEKDKSLRTMCHMNRGENGKQRPSDETGDFNISKYGHQEVDRFGVLLDLWTNEAAFLECKKELFDGYLEAYHHVCDRDERRHLVQVLTDVMHSRPQLDFEAEYFVRSYRTQCICLRQHAQLVKSVMERQIEDQRLYVKNIHRSGGGVEFGLPYRIIAKHPVSVGMNTSGQKSVYFLEFHPSLAIVSRLPAALKHAYLELYHVHKPASVSGQLQLETAMLALALTDWHYMLSPGSPYASNIQHELFNEAFIENPCLVTDVAVASIQEQIEAMTKKSSRDKQKAELETFCNLLQVITVRHRLIDAAVQSALLAQLYRTQAMNFGYDEAAIDRNKSTQFQLAINEPRLAMNALDEGHVGRFSFRTRETVLQLLREGNAESLEVTLMCQVVQCNAFMCAVQQVECCQLERDVDARRYSETGRPLSALNTKSSEKSNSAVTMMTATTHIAAMPKAANGSSSQIAPPTESRGASEVFISLQMEKIPCRDLLLSNFAKKKQQLGIVLHNPHKMEELKNQLIKGYCEHFFQRISHFSLRSQIVTYYNSIKSLLTQFPGVREMYFMLGESHEKKTDSDIGKVEHVDPKQLSRRPRSVLSADGRHVLNLWFVPHASEVLGVFRRLEGRAAGRALTHMLQLAAALHDMLHYLCAHARLGSAKARLGRRSPDPVSATWGGTEGIGADLRDIQREVDSLSDRTSPDEVCTFLSLRRDVMFLEFDAAVRHAMTDMFLSTNNLPAYQAVTDCMHFALDELSNAQKPSFYAAYMNVPEPFEARDAVASLHYPWRSFINRNGLFPVHFEQIHEIEYNMQLCLASLTDVDRQVCNGEILGVSLLLEDVLSSGDQEPPDEAVDSAAPDERMDLAVFDWSRANSHTSQASSVRLRTAGSDQLVARSSFKRLCDTRMTRTQHPLASYSLLRRFLRLWKQLEVLKAFWAEHRLKLWTVNTPAAYTTFTVEYRREILYPIVQCIARRVGTTDLYQGMVFDQEPLVMPRGTCELETRIRQLVKLLEYAECTMITKLRAKLAKQLNLALTEHSRGESGIPTDLWKRPAIKETFSVLKPHIADSFAKLLMGDVPQDGETVTFKKSHLQRCLSQLSRDVMGRERLNYESYSMFYENLLRTHHQLLYKREQELKRVSRALDVARNETDIEVQCQLADRSEGLLLEVTALRAKVGEMREAWLTQKADVRQAVTQDYDSLVDDLFSNSFDLKKRFDEFRINLHNDVMKHISETRTEAMQAISKLRQRNVSEVDGDSLQDGLAYISNIEELQKENHFLNLLIVKLKMMNYWRNTISRQSHHQKVSDLHKRSEQNKKENIDVRMLAEEEVTLLQQQQTALRDALKISEKKSEEVKKELVKELEDKKEREHEMQQRLLNERHLEDAKNANIDRLAHELGERDTQLRSLATENEHNVHVRTQVADKLKRSTQSMRKQLLHERFLKLDAFQRVDQLQAQIYDIENGMYGSRPQTAAAASVRVGSASNWDSHCTELCSTGQRKVSGSPHVRVSTEDELRRFRPNTAEISTSTITSGRIKRPKTTSGHVRQLAVRQLLGRRVSSSLAEQESLVPLESQQRARRLSRLVT